MFRYSTPPESRLHPTGSPWHEYLNRHEADGKPEYVVLFLSSAGRQTSAGEQPFEEFVRRLIDVCGRRHWRLGIKLHPKETGDWYVERGWSEHVIDSYPEIQDALSNTQVAITTGSSTLVEALVLDTPICKWFDQQSPMERKRDFELLFHITPETIEPTVESAMDAMAERSDATSVVNCHGTTDRIVKAVTEDATTSATASR